ncbi:FAD-dependent oxidoreductase [bacterium]
MEKQIADSIKVGTLELRNRMYAVPMVSVHADEKGNVTQRLIDMYEERGKGGWGMVCVEASSIRYDGRLFSKMLGIYKDEQIGGLGELADVIREGGAKSCIQIMHGGRQANSSFNGGVQPMAPSAVSPWPPDGPLPREMTTQECEQMGDYFAQAAGRAKEAGFDSVQLHGAHGFLIQQFMSPYTNQRKDRYGDKLEFVTEVIKKVRKVVGSDYPISFRVSADEYLGNKGIVIDNFTKVFAPAIEKAGVDWIDVSAGTFETLVHWVPSLYFKKAYLVDLAEKVKKVVNVPVSGIGKINDPNLARKLIKEEKVDMVAFGRQSLADPEFAKKLLEGRDKDIRQCIYCDMGCTSRLLNSVGLKCAVNFEFAKDNSEKILIKADKPQNVMVIGGGVAGMEASRILTLRGHKVSLYEKDAELGGVIKFASAIPGVCTGELMRVVNFLKNELKKLNVKIELRKEVTSQMVAEVNPDVVILATGSFPELPPIQGIDKKNVFTHDSCLRKEAEIGEKVIVLGGNYGAEIALSLAKKGKKVTMVEESENIAVTPYIYLGRMLVLQGYLKEEKVEVLTESKVKEITDKGVFVVDKEGNEKSITGDTVIIALERKPNNDLAHSLASKVSKVYEIGDCVKPSNILNAINQANILSKEI